MKNIIFVVMIMLSPFIIIQICNRTNFFKNRYVLNVSIVLLVYGLILYFVSPEKIFILPSIIIIFLCVLVMKNFYDEMLNLNLTYTPELQKLEAEIDSIKLNTEKIVLENKILEQKLIQQKELFRVIEEINENLDLNKLFLEFYKILQNKFGENIIHIALLKLKKKDVLEVFVLPETLDKKKLDEIKHNYLYPTPRSEFKNYVSNTLFSHYYEYRIAVEYSDKINKEKIVPQIQLLFEETKIGFERAILFKEVEEMSRIDGLTGLYLRRYFMDRLEKEFLRATRYNTKFSILMFDIDFFKKINDTYGHLAGDYLLKSIAEIFKNTVGQIGLISRWGGEEFLIFLPYHDKNMAVKLAEEIRETIALEKFLYNEKVLHITISCGLSFFPDDDKEINKLIEIADNWLYKAKNTGRNKVMFSQ